LNITLLRAQDFENPPQLWTCT